MAQIVLRGGQRWIATSQPSESRQRKDAETATDAQSPGLGLISIDDQDHDCCGQQDRHQEADRPDQRPEQLVDEAPDRSEGVEPDRQRHEHCGGPEPHRHKVDAVACKDPWGTGTGRGPAARRRLRCWLLLGVL